MAGQGTAVPRWLKEMREIYELIPFEERVKGYVKWWRKDPSAFLFMLKRGELEWGMVKAAREKAKRVKGRYKKKPFPKEGIKPPSEALVKKRTKAERERSELILSLLGAKHVESEELSPGSAEAGPGEQGVPHEIDPGDNGKPEAAGGGDSQVPG